MTGILDVGGGMRGIYTAGVYDFLIDRDIYFDYYIGVSAGSANLMSYAAKQRGRTLQFYTDYTFRKQYMSLSNFFHRGSYIDMDYIYSTLSNSDGENPLDYRTIAGTGSKTVIVATDAGSGKPRYFTNNDIHQDDYRAIKASCSIPVVCRPYQVGERFYFDGGISDPIPYKRAFDDGCDRLVVVLTLPRNFRKSPQKHIKQITRLLKKYPEAVADIAQRHIKYNTAVEELFPLEKAGKLLIIAPDDCCGVDTLTKNKEALQSLYDKGYENGKKIETFITVGTTATA